ncbi:hypothetical protein [Endothiovibrio diazotrophicus]
MEHLAEEPRTTVHPPEVGSIYRDAGQRSFLVLSASHHTILIEYADGHTRRVAPDRWSELRPTRSLF